MKKDIVISSIVIIVCVAFIILLNSIATKQNTQKIEQERIEKIKQDSIARAEFIRDSIITAETKNEILQHFSKDVITKYESYTKRYIVLDSGDKFELDFNHYRNKKNAFFYCNQIKKLKNYIDISVKTEYINELECELNYSSISYLRKLYRLYKLYGYEGVNAIHEWQPIDEVERLIKKQWDNRPYGEGGDSDFIKSVVEKYY
jgi:hypothetical protein